MAESRPRGFSPACLDAETVAAFVDGTLEPVSREGVVSHLASCPDCSELVAEVVQTVEDLPADFRSYNADGQSKGKVLSIRRRGLAAAGGLTAIAAALLLVVLNRGSALDPLVQIVGSKRPTVARPTGGFHYGSPRSPVRSDQNDDDLQIAAEAARLRERAERTQAPADLHAYGIARLLAGDNAGAIDSLEAAVHSTPAEPRYVADLGAAYMTRFVERAEYADATQALELLDRALSLSPALKEAWFNRALLLERLNRPADALSSWNKYLELPDAQPWREEAIRNRDALQRQLGAR